MSNGERWQDYFNKNVVACPAKFSFGSIFVVEGVEYICKDRGGAIVQESNGAIWLDVLTDEPKYKFGQELEAILID